MSLEKLIICEGDKTTFPHTGDTVTVEYTGWLYDTAQSQNRGRQFDSSIGRGDFRTVIGTGKVIQGWEQEVPKMSLGERAVLTIPAHMAYDQDGFPDFIPPNATLIFEMCLKKID